MPSKLSEPFRIRVRTPSPDNTSWLGGNGNWADGASPGNPTYKTLQGAVDSINPITGGWAALSNTALNPVLLTRAEAGAIDSRIWQTTGSKSVCMVWGGGGFDGKSFLVGAIGGHGAYAGNEMYRVRVTDPPAAVRMYNPSPLVSDATSETSFHPEWGPVAIHTYDGTIWDPVISRFLHCGAGGSTRALGLNSPIWSFDPTAATPRSAWRVLSGNSDGQRSINYPSICALSDTECYVYSNTNFGSYAISYADGTRRTMGRPTDPWVGGGGPWFSGDYNYLRHVRSAGIVFHTKITAANPIVVNAFAYDTATRRNTPASSANQMPSWFYREPSHGYRTIAPTPDGLFCVGWLGTHRVWCWDRVANVIRDFAASAPTQPAYPDSAGGNGIHSRWACVPNTTPKCFVGINSCNQNLWVFRPPAAWGVS